MEHAPDDESLRALLVGADAELLRTLDQAIRSAGDRTLSVMDLAEAVAAAQSFRPHLAFVDVTLGGGSGVALVHHLQAVRDDIAVYALAPPDRIGSALEAIALGAAGMLVLPTSGDAALRAVGEVRTRRSQGLRVVALEEELDAARRGIGAMQTLAAELARGGPRALIAATARALHDVAGGDAATVYVESGGVLERASSIGSSTLPQRTTDAELARVGSEESRRLLASERVQAVVEGAHPARVAVAAEALAFVSQLLALKPVEDERSPRFEPRARFEQLVLREVERARRHRRQFAIASLRGSQFAPARGGRLEDVFRTVVRDGDVLSREAGDDEILLLLPDTGALGAQLCRRRLGLGAVGLATFPNDAPTGEALLGIARQRREVASTSPVRALGLDGKGLRDIVDALTLHAHVDAGVATAQRLQLAMPAALSFVQHVCHETRRTGACSIVVASRSGVGLASAVREAASAPGEKPLLVEIDVERVPGAESIEALVVAAEHGTWACCGVTDGDRVSLVHAADAMLGDLIVQRLTELAADGAAREAHS